MSNSDNKFGKCCGCPALMSDGRIFTNYLLNSKLNSHIQNVTETANHHELRLHLQQNAEKTMENERRYFNNNLRCDPHKILANAKCNTYSYEISGNEINQ